MKFELLQPFGSYKPGDTFDPYGGLVCGISNADGDNIRFDDKAYFKVYKTPDAHILGLAFSIIGDLYQTQLDKGGEPMIMHFIRVMMNPHCSTDTRKVLALLHDCAEDGLITLDQLHTRGIPINIITKLNILWHKKYQTYEEYIALVASDPDCKAVKMADLEDNSQLWRLKGLRQKDFARMEKYHKAYTYLKN